MNDCLYLLRAEDTDAVLLGQDSDRDPVTLHLSLAHTDTLMQLQVVS